MPTDKPKLKWVGMAVAYGSVPICLREDGVMVKLTRDNGTYSVKQVLNLNDYIMPEESNA